MDLVRLERDGAVARVILDRADKLNAVNNAMWERIVALFTELDADPSVRCVIISGEGPRAFSVGADIAEFEENRSSVAKARAYGVRIHGALGTILGCRHPVIAEISGLCVGGGLELACCCDLRIAGEGARFGIPVKRLGLVVAYNELRPLVELVGPSNAMEILLEGEVFGARRAYDMGLVNRLVPDEGVTAEADATAARICDGAPLVARWHKKFTRRLMDPAPLSAEELDESFTCFGTEDFQTGYQAFLAKTKPEFSGR